MTKLYQVEFNEYTNSDCTTVCDPEREAGKGRYISAPKSGFFVREEHLEFVNQWGEGIRSKKLVGELFNIPLEIPRNYIVED